MGGTCVGVAGSSHSAGANKEHPPELLGDLVYFPNVSATELSKANKITLPLFLSLQRIH